MSTAAEPHETALKILSAVRDLALYRKPEGAPVRELPSRLDKRLNANQYMSDLDADDAEAALNVVNTLVEFKLAGYKIEPGSMDLKADGGLAKYAAGLWVQMFKDNGAQNNLEFHMSFKDPADPAEMYTVSIQRRAGKSPAEQRAEAQQQVKDLTLELEAARAVARLALELARAEKEAEEAEAAYRTHQVRSTSRALWSAEKRRTLAIQAIAALGLDALATLVGEPPEVRA